MKFRWLCFLALVSPVALQAQGGPTCDLGNSRQVYLAGGGAVMYLGGPVFNCNNGTTIHADSGVYVQSTGRVDFMGSVRFDEADRALTSQYAQYVGRERRLMAQGNVVLTDKRDGSVLRAPALDYFQKGGSNPEDRIEIYSGRPHATLYRKRSNNAGVIDTTNVDADRMTILGQRAFRGFGNVQTVRGKLTTKSGYAEFDQDSNYMKLHDHALVQTDTFRLSADSIDADLVNGDEFKTLRARGDVKLDGDQVDVAAPRLRIEFVEGNVERTIAVGGARVAADMPQATATSQDFNLTADSIDALSPKQQLEKVIAVGGALGERAPDSLDAKLPALIAKDWVRGDTVQAFFGATEPDTARALQRLVAVGNPASSTYKLREKVNDSTQISVNYLTARHIDVAFKEGAVDQVRAQGDIRGLYLQPARPEPSARTR